MWRIDRSLKLGGLSLKDLRSRHSQVAEAFETETIDIMSVVTDNEDDINELFVRLHSTLNDDQTIRIRCSAAHADYDDELLLSVEFKEDMPVSYAPTKRRASASCCI